MAPGATFGATLPFQHESQPAWGGLEEQAMPKHSPQRDQGVCEQHFPASLCHTGAHSFASSLPGREWMSLNLHPLPNLAEISQQAQKPSGGAGVDTQSTQHTHCWGNQAKEGAASSCDWALALLTVYSLPG